MHCSLIYRFNKIVTGRWLCTIIAILVLSVTISPAQAQDEDDEEEQAEEIVAPPQSNRPLPSLRQVPDSTVSQLKRDEDFAYANDPAFLKRKKEPPPSNRSGNWLFDFFSNKAVKGFFYVLLIALFIFIIYRIIVVNNLFMFRPSSKVKVDNDLEEEVLLDDNLEDKIKQAINAKQYRAAVRYQYLKGLRMLNDRGLIRYHAQSTNHDYVYQLSQYPVVADFRFLTQVYDYVWYGEFAVNEEQFALVQNNFQRFYQAIKK